MMPSGPAKNQSYGAQPRPPRLIILPFLKPPPQLQLPGLANWL